MVLLDVVVVVEEMMVMEVGAERMREGRKSKVRRMMMENWDEVVV